MGGKLQLKLNTAVRPIIKKYHKGKLQRISEAELKKIRKRRIAIRSVELRPNNYVIAIRMLDLS